LHVLMGTHAVGNSVTASIVTTFFSGYA
jgi:hypothetical protein